MLDPTQKQRRPPGRLFRQNEGLRYLIGLSPSSTSIGTFRLRCPAFDRFVEMPPPLAPRDFMTPFNRAR